MAEVRAFQGVRFDFNKIRLGRVLCPPYDVIKEKEAGLLRRQPKNAIHLELPQGQGAQRYRNAAAAWKAWRKKGVLVKENHPAFYVCEEEFVFGGRRKRRLGFLAALGLNDRAASDIIRHEKTLPKPKKDRLKLLSAVKANTSPIFGLIPDPRAQIRKRLKAATRGACLAQGRNLAGVKYRLWTLSDPQAVRAIEKALAPLKMLIADGHHRFEVARAYWLKARSTEAQSVLAYLCPEEDAGLVMLPTHRVVAGRGFGDLIDSLCRVRDCSNLGELLKKLERSKNPYALGCFDGRYRLIEPRQTKDCRSGLCVEWLSRHLLQEVLPENIRYSHEDRLADAWARESRGTAFFVKNVPVSAVRKAVSAAGLLPPKSTYFYPKVATGLVFKSLVQS